MFLFILLIIALYTLFGFLCYWHYNLVKSSEIKGDKEKLCKTVRLVLIGNAASVLLCLMMECIDRIDDDLFMLYSSLWLFLCFPLAIGSYIWMIVKEILQIKNKNLNLKNLYLLLSLILITVAGLFLYCIGLLLTLEKF